MHPHSSEVPGEEARFTYASAPRRVYWELTRACALACQHCRAEAMPRPSPDELSLEEIFATLDHLSVVRPRPAVVLTGGDPLERPDFWEILAYAKSLGLHVDVAPSATPRLTRAVIERLADEGVGAMSLSLDGSEAESHDAVRGIAGCYDTTWIAAAHITGANIPLQVNTLVTAHTLDDLPAIAERVGEMGARRWSLFFLVTTGRGSLLPQITAEQSEVLFEWLHENRDRWPFVTATTEAPHFRRFEAQRRKASDGGKSSVRGAGMRDGNGVMFISAKGEVMPSGFLPLSAGNVRDADPVSIYRDSELFVRLRATDGYGGRCGVCEYRDLCGGSRGRAFAHAGDPLAEDPLCSFVP